MSATREPFRCNCAASSIGSSSGLLNASRKTASTRVRVALPPEPCDIVIRSSRTLGRRLRARSIRSRTCCSRSLAGVAGREMADPVCSSCSRRAWFTQVAPSVM